MILAQSTSLQIDVLSFKFKILKMRIVVEVITKALILI